MAKIESSRAKIYETKATFVDEPTQHVESEGERLIKSMVQKQLDTHLNLEEQLKQTKEFQRATEIVPLSSYTSGQVSLKDFQHSAQKASHIEELKSYGLSTDEIELLLDYEKGEDFFSEKYKKLEKSVLSSRLLGVHDKVKEGKKHWENLSSQSNVSSVSRHEQELGLCVKPDSDYTKLLRFALSCQPSTSDARPASHPINNLKHIADELFGHLIKKKRKSKQECVEVSVAERPRTVLESKSLHSLWDVKERKEVATPKKPAITRVYSCKPETLYTVKDGKILLLENNTIDECCEPKTNCLGQKFVVTQRCLQSPVDVKNKLSLDEIKSLPRFGDYKEGIPSKVLYAKNLVASVKEEDLVSLFEDFEDPAKPRILYRLMGGKMKGQAFITFPSNYLSVDIAKVALESTNGVLLKGKPVIIQYGKQTS